MSITYTITTNFGAKDTLPTGDSAKIIKGAEFTTEFNAIKSAFALAAPVNNATFTGTTTIPTAAVTSLSLGGVDLQTTLDAKAPLADPSFTGFSSTGINDDATETAIDIASNEVVSIGPSTSKIKIIPQAAGGPLISSTDGSTGALDMELRANNFEFTNASFTSLLSILGSVSRVGINKAVPTKTLDVDGDALVSGNVETTTAFKLGDWEIKLDSTDLVFNYNGTDVFKITTAGAAIALDDVTAFGTP